MEGGLGGRAEEVEGEGWREWEEGGAVDVTEEDIAAEEAAAGGMEEEEAAG